MSQDDSLENLRDEEEQDIIDEDVCDEPVTLGFLLRPQNQSSLLSHLFPSKAGGFPAWLDLDPINLPSGRSCVCDICGNPLQFLLQVYAPISEKESAFHRTLFVFMCPSMSCLLQDQHEQWKKHESGNVSRSVKVFRCQLPRANRFYSSEPPRHDGIDEPLGNGVMGETQWPEHEIIIEDESESDTEVLDKFANLLPPIDQADDETEAVNSLMESLEGDDDKNSWASFQVRIAKAPEQVLRYCRSARAKPLWPAASGRLSIADIPKCSYCGAQRIFEFQYWYYEYIRIPAPVLQQPVEDLYPRMLRWARERQQVIVGGIDHSLSAFRRKLEEATFYSVMWLPFSDSQRIFSDHDCMNALSASRFRFPLNYTGICLWYLGDRHWRQLTGVPSIPHPPPQSMKISGDDWDRWSLSGEVPISAHGLRMDVDLDGWTFYWKSVSRGPILAPRYRDTNTDEVNPASSYDYRLLPVAPRVFQPPGPYPVPSPCDNTQYFVPTDLDVPGTSQRIRLPTEPYTLPVYASPFEMERLAQQLGQSSLTYQKQLTRVYDQWGWPVEEFGYVDGAGPSTTDPTTGGAPPVSDQPGFDWSQVYGSMGGEQYHNLGDDDDED